MDRFYVKILKLYGNKTDNQSPYEQPKPVKDRTLVSVKPSPTEPPRPWSILK